ncbi:hypothetical protein [Lentzea albidocapillata]|uniref:hypothetical protein n=1 Tax=Lentzea albidocapillata TaxID=40571 RepID=UPI0011600A4B|nr:hypothetical protein [Lentzea albidocapillata]
MRSKAMRNVIRCRLVATGLERQAVEQPPRGPVEQRAAAVARLRAHRAWSHAAATAVSSYRDGSAAREFAESTARLLDVVVDAMQRELALMDGA